MENLDFIEIVGIALLLIAAAVVVVVRQRQWRRYAKRETELSRLQDL